MIHGNNLTKASNLAREVEMLDRNGYKLMQIISLVFIRYYIPDTEIKNNTCYIQNRQAETVFDTYRLR